ncbi:MAG: hypothetical protein IJA59_00840, partial [Clostridia bacterium]|nr:hypothetical protein [Clostridia bacterium]
EQAPRTAALWTCVSVSPFLLWQKRAGFALRRSPEGVTTQAVGRPITQSVIASAKRIEKESDHLPGRACSQPKMSLSFSYSLPK